MGWGGGGESLDKPDYFLKYKEVESGNYLREGPERPVNGYGKGERAMLLKWRIPLVALMIAIPAVARAVTVTPEEMLTARRWVATKFEKPEVPFSFVYGGKPSVELLKTWKLERASKQLDDQRTERTLTWTDPKTGLVVRCVAVEYNDFPTVEWTVYFKNTSNADTPIIENIQALDIKCQQTKGQFMLNHHTGDNCSADSYQPHRLTLTPKSEHRFSPKGGRPSTGGFPYFNVEWPGQGMIIAVGWPGQWASRFTRDKENRLRIRAGQELTHFKLLPGEEVRSPLVVLQFWKGGDWLRAQNVWRRWFIAHNIHKPGGKLPPIQWAGGSGGVTRMMIDASEKNQKAFIDAYLDCGVKPDLWWMDAGWYPCDGNWTRTGTWEFDKKRFPNGLRPVTDYLHANNIRAILWFEPERVMPGTSLYQTHPEWLLGKNGGAKLLNLGNPEAWNWLLNHVDHIITKANIDIYRQDFNFGPLGFWRANDAENRQGITEIRHVTGLLAYWDELLRRHPNMLYDNCASGGRRNDLESMRRGVPYTKSDYWEDPVGVQGQTYGISLWLPYFCASWGWGTVDPYTCRSKMAHTIGASLDLRKKEHPLKERRKRLEEWRKTVVNYWGDYWPLTPYSVDNAAWMAWQFDRPESGEGVVQAFRRAESPQGSACYKLRGLDPKAQYVVTNLDKPEPFHMSGRQLMADGLSVTIQAKPGAVVICYKRK